MKFALSVLEVQIQRMWNGGVCILTDIPGDSDDKSSVFHTLRHSWNPYRLFCITVEFCPFFHLCFIINHSSSSKVNKLVFSLCYLWFLETELNTSPRTVPLNLFSISICQRDMNLVSNSRSITEGLIWKLEVQDRVPDPHFPTGTPRASHTALSASLLSCTWIQTNVDSRAFMKLQKWVYTVNGTARITQKA